MKKFKKLLALGLSVGVLASSMICASAVTPSLDELIWQADRRSTWGVRLAHVPDSAVNTQRGQIYEAKAIYNELCQLRDSGTDVSDDILNGYVQRLEEIGVDFS